MNNNFRRITLPHSEVIDHQQFHCFALESAGTLIIDLTKALASGKSPMLINPNPTDPLAVAYFKSIYHEFIKLNCSDHVISQLTPDIKEEVFEILKDTTLEFSLPSFTLSHEDLDELKIVSEIITLSSQINPHPPYGYQSAEGPSQNGEMTPIDFVLRFGPSLPQLPAGMLLLAENNCDVIQAIESRLTKLKDETRTKVAVSILYNKIATYPNAMAVENARTSFDDPNTKFEWGSVKKPW